MADSYCLFRVRAEGRDTTALEARLAAETLADWRADGISCWGRWRGLFGLASNELFVMTAAAGRRDLAPAAAALPSGSAVLDTLTLDSTVRPETIAPLSGPGLYVFRVFFVHPEQCDELVILSRQVWETFETSADYASRPLGLFRPRQDGEPALDGRVRMLLVTWYDGFASWESSRAPAPEARENFRRRHALTAGTVAYATRLID